MHKWRQCERHLATFRAAGGPAPDFVAAELGTWWFPLMSHFIDMRDHYAAFDSSIMVHNFLRFPKRRWRRFNNGLQYQNRLRMSDFRRLHAESGWEVIGEDNCRQTVDVLRSVPLAPEFRHCCEQDLAVCVTWINARPSTRGSTAA